MHMGRKHEPAEVLRARGSWRAGGRTGEATFPIECPEPPEWLDVVGKDWFTKHALIALEAGYMAQAFAADLALGADAYSEYVELSTEIRKAGRAGRLCVTDKGNVIQHPNVGMRNQAFLRAHAIIVAYGLNPSAKASVKVGATKAEESSLEAFNAKQAGA